MLRRPIGSQPVGRPYLAIYEGLVKEGLGPKFVPIEQAPGLAAFHERGYISGNLTSHTNAY
jgi:hypothetical protein